MASATVAAPAKKRYHAGLTSDAPYYSTSVGGVSLSQITYVSIGGRDLPRLGEIHLLSEAQVKRFNDHLEKAVVRVIGTAPFRYDSDAGVYTPEDGDRPLKDFVFFREIREDEEPGLAPPETVAALEKKAQVAAAGAEAEEEASAKVDPAMSETLPPTESPRKKR